MATRTLVAICALTLSAFAVAAEEAKQDPLSSDPRINQWANRTVIGARSYERSASASGAFLYSKFKGKTLESKDWNVTVNPIDTVSIWYSRQNYLAKGASATSRLHANSDSYGFKWVFKKAKSIDDSAWAFQYEAIKTYDATAVTNGAAATYFPTKNQSLSVHYELPTGIALALNYTSVKAAGQGDSNVLSFGYGRDVFSNNQSTLRFQGFLIAQKTNLIVVKNRVDFRPVLQLLYRAKLTSWLFAEAEGSILPAGMAYAGGSTTGLSSFLIYDPGGAAEGLRKNLVGYGAIRLVAQFKF